MDKNQITNKVLEADSTITTCNCVYPRGTKVYTYKVDKKLAATLSPGDRVFVSHCSPIMAPQLVTVREVHEHAMMFFGTQTQSVLSKLDEEDLRNKQRTINLRLDAMVSTATDTLVDSRQVALQKELGIEGYFSL